MRKFCIGPRKVGHLLRGTARLYRPEFVREIRPHFGQFDDRRAGHFTGGDVFVGVAELLEDGATVAVAVQRDCCGNSRTTEGAFVGCGITEAVQRACADRLNHWKTTNAPSSRSMTSIATSLRFIPPNRHRSQTVRYFVSCGPTGFSEAVPFGPSLGKPVPVVVAGALQIIPHQPGCFHEA